MLRRLILFVIVAGVAPAQGAVFPDMLGGFQKQSERPSAVQDRAIWEEYGLEESVLATYSTGQKSFQAGAWRLRDSTSALAAFQWRRPVQGKPSPLAPLAVETATDVFLAHGNYVFLFQGYKPIPEMLAVLIGQLPRLDISPLPGLPDYLPKDGLVPLSERYIIGPVALKSFLPAVSPSVAGFHLGVEIQAGLYQTAKGSQLLGIFSYPTPHIARERLVEFRAIPKAVVKRSGPFLVAVFDSPDPDAAQLLLAKVNYQPSITWNERVPREDPNVAEFLITVFTFIGILIGFTVLAGAGMAGFRHLSRKIRGQSNDPDPMIMLHIEDR